MQVESGIYFYNIEQYKKKDDHMKLLKKVIDVLDFLSDAERDMGVTELSVKMNLPKSTVYRILKNLLEYSMVEQEKDTSRYRIGFRLLKYSNSILRSFDLRQIAKPVLKRVCNETGETTLLTVWKNDQGFCIDSIFSSQNINVSLFVEIGREMPCHCTAGSKIILANQSLEDIQRIINKKHFLKYTPNTIVDPKKLMVHLLEIKDKNYAICDEELQEGIKAIAAPIKDINGTTIASVTITGLAQRMTSKKMEGLIKLVTDAGKEISERLGHNKFIEK